MCVVVRARGYLFRPWTLFVPKLDIFLRTRMHAFGDWQTSHASASTDGWLLPFCSHPLTSHSADSVEQPPYSGQMAGINPFDWQVECTRSASIAKFILMTTDGTIADMWQRMQLAKGKRYLRLWVILRTDPAHCTTATSSLTTR